MDGGHGGVCCYCHCYFYCSFCCIVVMVVVGDGDLVKPFCQLQEFVVISWCSMRLYMLVLVLVVVIVDCSSL